MRWSRTRIRPLFALGVCCLVAAGSPALAAGGKRKPVAAPAAVKAPAPSPIPTPQVGVVLTERFWKTPVRCEEILIQPDGRIILSCRENMAWKLRLARLDPEGRPDAAFGGKGFARVELMYGAVALQADGKILAAGSRGVNQVGVARLTAAGFPDPGFGSGGTVQIGLGRPSLGAALLALTAQGDGKIVAAGSAHFGKSGGTYRPYSDFAVLRFLPGGDLDPSFGDRGIVGVAIGDYGLERAWAVVVGADGRLTLAGGTYAGLAPQAAASGLIALSGSAGVEHTGPHFGLVRLLADGALDPGFGKGGRSALVLGRVSSEPRSLTPLPDGKLLVAGLVGYAPVDFARPVWGHGIARFTADGLLDPSFGDGGSIGTALCAGDLHAKPIAVQPDGKIVLACPAAADPGDSRPVAERPQLLLMRYTADGAPDAGFGERGVVRARVLGGPITKTAVALPADGTILVMCSGRDAPPAADGTPRGKSVVALVRYRADGSLDPTFGAARP